MSPNRARASNGLASGQGRRNFPVLGLMI